MPCRSMFELIFLYLLKQEFEYQLGFLIFRTDCQSGNIKDKLPDGSSETGPNKWAPVASSPTASAIKAKAGWGART